tara:strand:+ start:194 stop:409 length:216 start_codon:yes stop_codon:yes gene_type:complete
MAMSEKNKKLAKFAPPFDKITQADIITAKTGKEQKVMGGGMIKPKKMMGGGMMYRGRKYAYGGKVSKYGKD